jgi:hypothetical protein
MMTIDTTNMCSHLQKKLFEEDGIYHSLWLAMQDDRELTAIVRSRQLHIYRNGKKVLVLAGKAAPKIIRDDRINKMIPSSIGPIQLIRLSDEHTIAFKEEMQEAFQHGFEVNNKDAEETNQWQVLPDKDFYHSLNAEGAEAYEAVSKDGQRMGGAIITVSRNMGTVGELAFLYVKVGVQSKGIGQSIWRAIESMHPEIEVWETCTPYFDRRNIHFYINRCGFHAVEFFNEHHPGPNMPEQFDQEDGLIKFEKRMK